MSNKESLEKEITAIEQHVNVIEEEEDSAKDDDDAMVKNIFNSGKHKEAVGIKIPSWMIMHEMKLTNHCRMYVAVFRVDVPTTQSQPIESTQGTHRTTISIGHLTLIWMKQDQVLYESLMSLDLVSHQEFITTYSTNTNPNYC
uniref:Uncharacterized protein n=1 Tax=Tanacetum cinerariifolium TaxID=118510 RepID=A0A699RKQ3_TANCI|nr:hypothetical protein [Tanacetum cinerariifolium]